MQLAERPWARRGGLLGALACFLSAWIPQYPGSIDLVGGQRTTVYPHE